MKKLIVFISVVTLAQIGYSQSLSARTYIERTSVGSKLGTAIGIENELGFEYGGFYQEASLMESMMNKEETTLPRFYEKEFFGLYGAAPLVMRSNYDLKLQVRMGVSNGESFLITPSLLANYHVFKMVSLGGGIGARSFRPTFQGSITIKL
jgi:hypothetical protein